MGGSLVPAQHRRGVASRHVAQEIDFDPDAGEFDPDIYQPGRIAQRRSETPLQPMLAPQQAQAYHGVTHPGIHPLAQQQIPQHLLAILDHTLGIEQEPIYVRLAHEHRALMMAAAPWMLAAIGWWTNAAEPMHPWIAAACDAVGVLFAAAGALSHYPHGQDADQIITRGLLAAGAGLELLGVAAGAGFSPISAGIAALATGGVLWGRHHVNRSRHERMQDVAVELSHALNPGPIPGPGNVVPGAPAPQIFSSQQEIRIFQAFAAAGIEGVQIGPIHLNPENPDTWEAALTLPPGKISREQVIKTKREIIAGNLGCRRLEMAEGARQGDLLVTIFDGEDRLLDWLWWDASYQVESFEDLVGVGFDEDHMLLELELLWRHILVAAQTGGGKSGLVNGILLNTLRCNDLVRIGIDAKSGAPELGPFRRTMHALADSAEAGYKVLLGLRALINERGLILQEETRKLGRPVKKWHRGLGPYVLVPIDELAELTRRFPDAVMLIESILQLGRYVGVHLLSATQTPSKKVFGGVTDARQQYSVRFGLRSTETTAINSIFGGGAHGRGWRLDRLDDPGKFMVQAHGHDRPRIYRSFQFDEDGRMIADAVTEAVESGCIISFRDTDPRSAAAFRDGVAEEYVAEVADLLGSLFAEEFPDGWARDEGEEEDTGASATVFQLHRGQQQTESLWSPSGRPRQRATVTFPDRQTPVPPAQVALWEELVRRRDAEINDLVALGVENFTSREPVGKLLRAWEVAGWVTSEKPGGSRAIRYYVDASAYNAGGDDEGEVG